MPKNKRPVPKKSNPSPEEKDDAVTQLLCDLAIDLVEQEDGESMRDELKQRESEFHKLIRKALNQKKDDILYESLERAKYADSHAYQFLKDSIEEAAGTIVFKRDDGSAVEVNAFVIPLFVWSKGGLDSRECFQDQSAFDALTKSFQDAQLESAQATVVLVNHVYHLDEIDSITYSHLNEMVRNAFASMTDKKMAATPAIERSFFGWPEHHFGADDVAVELRFFLGFALKAVDDVFYQMPNEETAADQYFATRMERFQAWAQQVAPIVKRCLVTDDAEIDVKFLYQDLFHGAKERGMAEYFMLQMMAELNQAITASGIAPKDINAIIGIADVAANPVLRVNLYETADDTLIASSDKPCAMINDVQIEFDDAYDAMMTLGVASVSIAMQFDTQGQPRDVRAYEA
ncbi:MAG TPA: DUF2863 family protein [Burkholderiaceae bacterium]|jgi:hypothetical protein